MEGKWMDPIMIFRRRLMDAARSRAAVIVPFDVAEAVLAVVDEQARFADLLRAEIEALQRMRRAELRARAGAEVG